MESMKKLESRIADAVEEIEALRKKNRSLSSQVKRLKRTAKAGDSGAEGAWEKERDEIAQRAEKIAATLESLLD